MAAQNLIASNDLSANDDFLGMKPRFEALAEFIGSCSTPMTVAIQGDWGTGKTTAMNNIRNIINSKSSDEQNPELTIWFNTWQFSVLTDNHCLIVDLLWMIAELLFKRLEAIKNSGQASEEQTRASESILRKAISVFLGVSVSALKYAAAQSNTVSGIKDIFSGFSPFGSKKQHADMPDTKELLQSIRSDAANVITLKETVNETIRELLKLTGKDRIYFFIDDLDRLSPHVAVELLECMKNFLDCEGCVFILAIDQDVIERGLRRKYGDDFDVTNSRRAAQFFDKIIQVPFELPVDSYKLEDYVAKLLTDTCILDDTENPADHTGAFLRIIKMFGEYNPRTIKRSFNLLALYRLMSENAASDIADRYAFVLLVIRARNEYKSLSRILSHLPDSGDLRRNLINALSDGKNLLSSPEIRALLNAFDIHTEAETEETQEETQEETEQNETESVRRLLLAYRETTEAIAERYEYSEEDSADEIAQRLEQALRRRAADGVRVEAEWKDGSRSDRILEVQNSSGDWIMRIRKVNNSVHVTVRKPDGMSTGTLLSGTENLFYQIGSPEERQFGYYNNENNIVLANLSAYFPGCGVDTLLCNAGIMRPL